MQNEPTNQQESLWRRSTAQAKGSDSSASAERELEVRLTDALSQLKDTPVASNFTARLMAEIDREEAAAQRQTRRAWRWSLWPRLAGVAAALMLVAGVMEHHETVAQRHQLAQTLASVADLRSVPSVEALKNFDAIQAMSQHARADEELLALAQ